MKSIREEYYQEPDVTGWYLAKARTVQWNESSREKNSTQKERSVWRNVVTEVQNNMEWNDMLRFYKAFEEYGENSADSPCTTIVKVFWWQTTLCWLPNGSTGTYLGADERDKVVKLCQTSVCETFLCEMIHSHYPYCFNRKGIRGVRV